MILLDLVLLYMIVIKKAIIGPHLLSFHCYIKCPFLGLGASFGQFCSNGISFHHELIFAMGLEF